MSASQYPALRRWVWTGSIAAITATGVWYGAGLKIRQERKQEQERRLEATPAQHIEQLQNRRARLVRERNELQRKIDGLAAKNTKSSGDG